MEMSPKIRTGPNAMEIPPKNQDPAVPKPNQGQRELIWGEDGIPWTFFSEGKEDLGMDDLGWCCCIWKSHCSQKYPLNPHWIWEKPSPPSLPTAPHGRAAFPTEGEEGKSLKIQWGGGKVGSWWL